MPTQVGGTARYDINDPADVQVLVSTGMAWKSGPKTLQAIIALIKSGKVKRVPERETPEVRTYLDKVAPVEAPVEPTVASGA